MNWTEQAITVLKEMQAEGFSASWIASELKARFRIRDLSRNAVIGKLHRMGFHVGGSIVPTHPATVRPRERPARVHRPKPQPPRPETVVAAAVETITAVVEDRTPVRRARTLLELGYGDCRWPIGEPGPGEFFFCGAPAVAEKPYCARHCARAYVTPRRRTPEEIALDLRAVAAARRAA